MARFLACLWLLEQDDMQHVFANGIFIIAFVMAGLSPDLDCVSITRASRHSYRTQLDWH